MSAGVARWRRIDDQIGEIGDARQQFVFGLDGLTQIGRFVRQRMAAPRFAEPFDQCGAERIEIDHFAVEIHPIERQQNFREALQIRGRVARVDADGHTLAVLLRVAQRGVDHGRQQPDRKVVDAVETRVFEYVQARCSYPIRNGR